MVLNSLANHNDFRNINFHVQYHDLTNIFDKYMYMYFHTQRNDDLADTRTNYYLYVYHSIAMII